MTGSEHGEAPLRWACKCGETFADAIEFHVHLTLHGATAYPLSDAELAEYERARASIVEARRCER